MSNNNSHGTYIFRTVWKKYKQLDLSVVTDQNMNTMNNIQNEWIYIGDILNELRTY